MVPCDCFEAVPLIPMQFMMAAAQIRAREHLQMLTLPVIMHLQDQPLPQPSKTIHNVACAPFQAITFGDALLLCSSSMHPLWHLITFKPMHRAHQQLKLRHARDLSPSFCTSCSLTLVDLTKFLVDSLDFSQVMHPFVKSFETFVPCTIDLLLARPIMHAFGAKSRIGTRGVNPTPWPLMGLQPCREGFVGPR